MFERLYFHEVTLANKYNQPLVQKSEITFQSKKDFIMSCSKLMLNGSGVLRRDQIITKLPILSKYRLQSLQFYFVLDMTDILYVLVMSRTRLRVNSHSIVAWMSRNSLLESDAKFKWLQLDSNPQPLSS